MEQYQMFELKHYFISEEYNNQDYYLLLYNRLPKLITCFEKEINVCDFHLIPSYKKNEFVGTSIKPLKLKLYDTKNDQWVSGLYRVKIVFLKEVSIKKFLPVHLIDII